MVLIAVLAAVAVPGSVGSRGPSPEAAIDPNLFRAVEVSSTRGTEMTTPTLDPAYRSDGTLDATSVLLDPDQRPAAPSGRPATSVRQPVSPRGVVILPTWRFDPNVSWYGPGFYGKRTACGLAYTKEIMGVAHRTLPCGTMVRFRNPYNGRQITVPVIDRGPYVAGRQWDLSGAACTALSHCWTGPIYWRFP